MVLATAAAQAPRARERKTLTIFSPLEQLMIPHPADKVSLLKALRGGGQIRMLQPDPLQPPPAFMGDATQQKPPLQTFASAAPEPGAASKGSTLPYKGALFTV